ncbi:hypothetical protein J6590_099073 [Homalodisca vitripennis]|nr:hypothetical protein J6590_099073 [Homalodisca vitripennis]
MKVFMNLFVNFGEQIISHNSRMSTLLLIMNVCSAIFKLNAPLPDRTLSHYVVHRYSRCYGWMLAEVPSMSTRVYMQLAHFMCDE